MRELQIKSAKRSSRIVTGAGFTVVTLFILSIIMTPTTELLSSGISANLVSELYQEHRTSILSGMYVSSLTWGAVFLVFAGALSSWLSTENSEVSLYAWIGFGGALAESAAILLMCVFTNAATFAAGSAEPGTVLALHQAALLANNLSGFPTVVCVVAYTLAGREVGLFPGWLSVLCIVCATFHTISSAGLAATGLLSPVGPASLLAPFTMTIWILGVSIIARRSYRSDI
jgi:hypothetical protein